MIPSCGNNHNDMPTIDLHGYRKSEAIRALTDFLEDVVTSSSRQHFPSGRRRRQQQLQQQEQQQQYDDDDDGDIRPKTMNTRNFKQYGDDFIWCLVITGTGAHSPEGPVLRGAVHALFEKRRMTFRLNKGGGSFTVNACSGIVLTKGDQPTDTKVAVSHVAEMAGVRPRRHGNSKTNGWYRPQQQYQQQMGEDQLMLQKTYRQQQNEKMAIQRALSQSMLESKKQQSMTEELIEQALKQSIIEAEKEQQEDQKQIEQALKQSIHDNRDIIEEETQLQQLLKHSALELQRQQQEEEETLLKLLKMSQNEHQQDEDELLKILELSVLDF